MLRLSRFSVRRKSVTQIKKLRIHLSLNSYELTYHLEKISPAAYQAQKDELIEIRGADYSQLWDTPSRNGRDPLVCVLLGVQIVVCAQKIIMVSLIIVKTISTVMHILRLRCCIHNVHTTDAQSMTGALWNKLTFFFLHYLGLFSGKVVPEALYISVVIMANLLCCCKLCLTCSTFLHRVHFFTPFRFPPSCFCPSEWTFPSGIF